MPLPPVQHRTVAVASLLAALISVLAPLRAEAGPPITCHTFDRAVDGAERSASGGTQFTALGARADVYVGGSLYCNRVSSLVIVSMKDSANDRVGFEFGWVLGWSSCNSTYYSTPRLFVWWSGYQDGNLFHCKVLGHAGAVDTFQRLRLSNVDVAGRWNSFLNGELIPSAAVTTNFAYGEVLVNAERSNSADTAFAEFINVQEHAGGDWSNTDNLRPAGDNDPDFAFNRVSGNHSQVVAE